MLNGYCQRILALLKIGRMTIIHSVKQTVEELGEMEVVGVETLYSNVTDTRHHFSGCVGG